MKFEEWWKLNHAPHTDDTDRELVDIIKNFSRAAWEAAQPKMQPMRTAPMHTDNFILLLVDGKYIECFWDNAASRWQTFAEWGVMGVYDPKGWLPMPAPPQETEK